MQSFLQNGNRCLQYLVLPLGHFTRGHATENRRNAKTAQPIWSKCEASDAHYLSPLRRFQFQEDLFWNMASCVCAVRPAAKTASLPSLVRIGASAHRVAGAE